VKRDNFNNGWMFKAIPPFIVIVFVVIVCFWIVIGFGVITAWNEISQHGLKAIAERVWEGPKK